MAMKIGMFFVLSWSCTRFMCACAQKAKANNYEYFGIENYGECWSGMTAKYSVHGPSGSCHMVKENECAFEACDEQRNKFRLCVGASVSMYVYKIKQKQPPTLPPSTSPAPPPPTTGSAELLKGFGEIYLDPCCSSTRWGTQTNKRLSSNW
ncbi:hypothetical protein OS493_000873 [Desmophyllum pertusum]|uniref:Secreted protein n=1 Tax=Desmophyllum pertusum TaxID=174260 RepID=A0A9W9ZTP3_9CNID|nr:hypothetical protein OS493_000873 [Desmophyllum pertusum]